MPVAALVVGLAVPMVAAFVGPPAPGPFAPEDLEDLSALIARGDAKAIDRITARFDAVIDEGLAAFEAASASGSDEKSDKKGAKRAKAPRGKDRDAAKQSKSDDSMSARLASSAAAWRLALLAKESPPPDGEHLWSRLQAAPDFAEVLAFAYVPKKDHAKSMWPLVDGVLEEDGKLAERYPELAAAICVVYDNPGVGISVNENRARPPSPGLLWRYYTNNAARMRFGMNIAPELLTYVVDVSASTDDIAWALGTFGGIQRVGALYPKVPYDYDVLQGKQKKSDKAGWNLPNIYKYGGICADQAYFTATVAKALGIPATYTVGQNASSAHAWTGFAQAGRGKSVGWDVEGRYDSYRGTTGNVVDAQTGTSIPDAVMPMLVQWGLEPPKDRERACALRAVDERLQMRSSAKGSTQPVKAASREAILREALNTTPTDVRTWQRVSALATSGALTLNELTRWLDDITRLCGASYPEMVLEVAEPIIASVKDTGAQHDLWMKLANTLAKRADLAGQALLRDGRMWERAGQGDRAGQAYEALLKAYPDGGPYVEEALERAGKILAARNDGKHLFALYESTFTRMHPPEELPGIFGRESTWYQVGKSYVNLLRQAGRGSDATTLDGRIERQVTMAGQAGS